MKKDLIQMKKTIFEFDTKPEKSYNCPKVTI